MLPQKSYSSKHRPQSNPTRGMVQVPVAKGPVKLVLLDGLSRVLRRGEQSQLSVMGLALGLYVLRIYTGTGTETEMLVRRLVVK